MLLNLVGFIRLGYAEVQRAIMGFQLCKASADVEKSDNNFISHIMSSWDTPFLIILIINTCTPKRYAGLHRGYNIIMVEFFVYLLFFCKFFRQILMLASDNNTNRYIASI